MTSDPGTRVLSVVVCGAGPASAISTFVTMATERGWQVQVIATPAALEFFDAAAIEAQTGNPIHPHPPRTGGDLIASYPWHLALNEAERLLSSPEPDPAASTSLQ